MRDLINLERASVRSDFANVMAKYNKSKGIRSIPLTVHAQSENTGLPECRGQVHIGGISNLALGCFPTFLVNYNHLGDL